MEPDTSAAESNRTRREFPFSGDVWRVVDAWAGENRFRMVKEDDRHRRYRRGLYLLMAPVLVEVSLDRGGFVVLEAWVKADPYIILAVLSGKTPEMAIDGGGLTAAVPRRRARETVNRLLKAFGQPEIS